MDLENKEPSIMVIETEEDIINDDLDILYSEVTNILNNDIFQNDFEVTKIKNNYNNIKIIIDSLNLIYLKKVLDVKENKFEFNVAINKYRDIFKPANMNLDDMVLNINSNSKNCLIFGDIHGDVFSIFKVVEDTLKIVNGEELNIILLGDVFDPLHDFALSKLDVHFKNLAFYDSYLIMYYILYFKKYKNVFFHWVIGNHDTNYGFSNIIYMYLLQNYKNLLNQDEVPYLYFYLSCELNFNKGTQTETDMTIFLSHEIKKKYVYNPPKQSNHKKLYDLKKLFFEPKIGKLLPIPDFDGYENYLSGHEFESNDFLNFITNNYVKSITNVKDKIHPIVEKIKSLITQTLKKEFDTLDDKVKTEIKTRKSRIGKYSDDTNIAVQNIIKNIDQGIKNIIHDLNVEDLNVINNNLQNITSKFIEEMYEIDDYSNLENDMIMFLNNIVKTENKKIDMKNRRDIISNYLKNPKDIKNPEIKTLTLDHTMSYYKVTTSAGDNLLDTNYNFRITDLNKRFLHNEKQILIPNGIINFCNYNLYFKLLKNENFEYHICYKDLTNEFMIKRCIYFYEKNKTDIKIQKSTLNFDKYTKIGGIKKNYVFNVMDSKMKSFKLYYHDEIFNLITKYLYGIPEYLYNISDNDILTILDIISSDKVWFNIKQNQEYMFNYLDIDIRNINLDVIYKLFSFLCFFMLDVEYGDYNDDFNINVVLIYTFYCLYQNNEEFFKKYEILDSILSNLKQVESINMENLTPYIVFSFVNARNNNNIQKIILPMMQNSLSQDTYPKMVLTS